MSVSKQKNGKWLCQIDRRGIKRLRRSFTTEKEAEIFERELLAKHQAELRYSSDLRTIDELITLWYKYHGINLSDGINIQNRLKDLSRDLGNPQASSLMPETFVNYRFKRISAGLTPKSFNNIHGYLSSMYNKLRKLKIIDYNDPVGDIDFIKIQERQLSYLSLKQIDLVLDEITERTRNQSTWYVAQLCLRTGARWGEAERLKVKQVHNGWITFEFTKSKKIRTVPIDADFYKDLKDFIGHKNPTDRVFKNCISAFRRAITRTSIVLPRGQNTHILRHSFASWFIMNGGDILTLQKILGHSDIRQTMRYAHLSPDHLQDAVRLNPLSKPNNSGG